MAKGTKTARELEDMIMDRLGIGGVFVAGLQAAEHPSVDETAIIDTATSPPKPSRYVEARPGRLRRLGCLAHFMGGQPAFLLSGRPCPVGSGAISPLEIAKFLHN
jgi:hypothetical protein